MILRYIKIEAAGATGWFSNELEFGENITQLFGPNGCGKTPIIQSVAYALGYPVKYREDIYNHCKAVLLRINVGGRDVELRRAIQKEFDIEVRVDENQSSAFYDERSYSAFLFDLFGVDTTTLTSKGNEPVPPYLSAFLPLFYLDQDAGYTSLYSPPSSFYKNQYAEMIRLCFGLPPKHSYDKKKHTFAKQRELDELDRAVVRQQQLLENLNGELGTSQRASAELDSEILAVRTQISSLEGGRGLADEALSAINRIFRDRQKEEYSIEAEIGELRERIDGFGRIMEEIEVEIRTLSLNEEARRLFESFRDICANPNCGLFLGSVDSYGKNLLYLRDQLKDLDRNRGAQELRIVQLEKRLTAIRSELTALEKNRQDALSKHGLDAVIDTISELTSRVVALQKEKQVRDALNEEQREYVSLLNKRERIQNDLASLNGSADASDLRILELMRSIRERIVFWLDTLRTRNVSREVRVDGDFGVEFGQEKIAQFAGSTLLRVILAIRTAVFEVYSANLSNKFRF